MAQKFLTDIEVTRGLVDSSGDLGVAGQVLSSTGTGTNWITNEANSTVVYLDEFTGDNSTVDFTLSVSVTDENITQAYIDGVYQNKDTYSVSNTTLTFSTAPPLNADIEVITFSTATTSDDLQAGVIIIPVKNTHTASIDKGEPVYITGNVGSSARLQIAPADASNSAKMPAAGLLLQTLAVNAEGYVVTGGYLRNITTDTIDGTSTSSNDTVYVKAGGGLTMTKPTGTNLIQNIAKIARSSSGSSGSLLVSSILRTNDVPNITNDYFWLGNSSGVATPTEFTSTGRGLLSVGTEGTAAGDGNLAYNNSSGVFTYTPPVLGGLSGTTDDITEGSTNLYYTDARARSAISVSGNAISYNSSTGVITANYEESPTFTGDVIISGNLTVNGTQTILSTQTVEVEDNILQLNTTQGSPDTATATTSGISIYRGSGVTQASFIFDDADDTWDLTNNLSLSGKILVGTGATAAASLNAYTQTVSANLYSALRIIENSGASSYWDIGATGGGSPSLNFYVNAATTPKLTISSSGNATFAGDVYVTGSSNSNVVISRDNMYVDAGQFYIGADDAATDDSFRQRTASGSYFIESRKSGTWTNRLQINSTGTLIASQGATFAGDVMPAAENAYNIGSAAVRWEDLYVDDGFIRNAYIDDYIYHNGDTDTYINFTDDTIKLSTAGGFGFELDSNRDINSPDRLYMRQTYFGYSGGYKVVQFGNAAATSAISLGYNPSGNTNGGFTGDEILIPHNKTILAPNAADNAFHGVLRFNNDKLLIGSSNYLIASNYIMALDPATQRVGIGTDSPTAKLDVKSNGGVGNGLNVIADFNRSAGADAQLILGYYADGSAVTGPVVYAANSLPLLFAAGGTEKIRIATNGSIYNSTNTTNAHFGLNALSSVTSADESTAFGSNALGSQQTGRNSAFGYHTLQDLTTGTYNTAFGGEALENITTGSFNTGCGAFTLRQSTTESYNTALGYFALRNNYANNNVAIGALAMSNANVTGTQNVVIGTSGMYNLTSGNYNTGVGESVMASLTTGSYNTAMGREALDAQSTGAAAVAIGYQSLTAANGNGNTAIGFQSGSGVTSGTYNVLIGHETGSLITTGAANIAIGDRAGRLVGAANYNVHIGHQAGYESNEPTGQVSIGFQAGYDNGGNYSVFVGYQAGYNTSSQAYNNSVGFRALHTLTSGGYNNAFGSEALLNLTTGNHNNALGFAALKNVTVGTHNIGIGYDAFQAVTNSSYNIGVGGSVGTFQTGNYNTSMGYFSNYGVSTASNGSYNSTYGYYAGAYNRGENNTFLGALAGRFNSTGVRNTIVGSQAADNSTITGSDNTALGFGAAHNISSAIENVSIGSYSFFAANGSQNVAVGKETLYYTTSSNNTAVGHQAGHNNTSGGSNTFIGRGAGYNNTSHDYGTFVGELAGYNNQNHYNAFFGRASGYNNTTGTRNTYIGYGSGYACTTGYDNTGIGTDVLANLTTGANNTALGRFALNNVASGDGNIAVGYSALGGATMSGTGNNIALGGNAGYNMTSGANNILIGLNAGRTGSQTPQSMGGVTTGSNQIHIGNESHTNALVQVSWTVNSDGRDKADVKNLDLGLDFINSLRPVTYRWDKRSQYEDKKPTGEHKESKLEIGLIAQEVIEQENKAGYNFEDETNLFSWQSEDKNKVGLQYEKLVPALINAIKELKEEIEILKSQINI